MLMLRISLTLALSALFSLVASPALSAEPVRVGILGLDNYQAVAFTQLFHNPMTEKALARLDPQARQEAEQAIKELAGIRVTAAVAIGSPDIPDSVENLPKWVERFGKMGIPLVPTAEELFSQCDCVMIMTLDGRKHLELARQSLSAKKPTFIARPMAASLDDVRAIFRLAEENKTPVWSSSQHRFTPGFAGMRNHPEVGKVLGVDVYGGCLAEPHHPELVWQALHGIETLFTIMGPGSESVRCVSTPYAEMITGVWTDGRVGTFRGIRQGKVKWSATVFGEAGVSTAGIYGHGVPVQGVVPTKDRYVGYESIAVQIAKFFRGGPAPVTPEQTLEIFTFMEAASQSKAKNGAPIEVKVMK
jgi:predicted dehydrogenase